jgi:hypothetical protein
MDDRYWVLDGHKPRPTDDVHEWGRFFNDGDKRRVAQTDIAGGDIFVSTVFIGIDHRFGEDGPPLLFETMIFGGPHDQYTDRYSTWDEAEIGHERAVRLARDGRPYRKVTV